MKNPYQGNGKGAAKNTYGGKDNIPERDICPNAPECRHWIFDDQIGTVICAHCFQNLSRADMARILAGPS